MIASSQWGVLGNLQSNALQICSCGIFLALVLYYTVMLNDLQTHHSYSIYRMITAPPIKNDSNIYFQKSYFFCATIYWNFYSTWLFYVFVWPLVFDEILYNHLHLDFLLLKLLIPVNISIVSEYKCQGEKLFLSFNHY